MKIVLNIFMRFKDKISKINLSFLIVFFLLVFFLFSQWLAPNGTWTCQQNYNNSIFNILRPACVSKPSPAERYEYGPNGELLILADPLYLSIFSPRPFQKIDLEIVYRPDLSENQPIFEAGFLADAKLWRYQLKPVYNYFLEELLTDWSVTSSSGLSLYQQEKNFDSLDKFLLALKNEEVICSTYDCLALYNIADNLITPKSIKAPSIGNDSQINLDSSLRGAHQFYIYLNNETLDLTGSFFDINENKDRDDLEILVYKDSHQVASLKIPDLRPEKELSSDHSGNIIFNLNRADLGRGLYKLEIRTNDDLVIKNLQMNSSYLSAINNIWIFGDSPTNIYTDANYLQAKAFNPLALQTLEFASKKLELKEIYQQYEIQTTSNGLNQIHLEKGGLILANHGVFAFSPSELVNPDYLRLDRFSFKKEKINYILANYESAKSLGDGWYRSSLSFRGPELYREDNHYNLIFSIPGLSLEGNGGGLIEVKEIKIKYSGPSLLAKLKSMIFKAND